ncbi:hypothetical protein [Methylotetracoccus oryzae]|uniref:hypothetical protein n=1 Tax=Methylotetracoccus oryzae TaxID=1919059 RepID=UPI001F22EDB5|nr:hypothetical protein [Methylotetracoccus oryzae]
MHDAYVRDGAEAGLSLVRNDLLFRLQRKLGLVPANGLGVVRRAIFWSLVAWLPVALWAYWAGHFRPEATGESLLQHFGVNARCLIAIPLFILAEGTSHRLTTGLIPYFETSGLVRPSDVRPFRELLVGVARLRDTVYPWIVILGLIVTLETLPLTLTDTHELAWAGSETDIDGLGFGGWWYLHVSRAIFLVLLLAWLWRVILLTTLFHRISKLDLQLVPTHPDGAGGLGFLERFPMAFSLVLLAISIVPASKWAHEVLYHGKDVHALQSGMIGLALVLLLVFASPYLVWVGTLARTRKQALLDYGALVGEHGRLVRRRWIDKMPVEDDAVLTAPELGPVADTVALYEAAQNMRALPLGKQSLLALVVPVALPMLGVVALRIPVKEILLTLLKALA